jgi:hypothetical protein
MALEHGTIRLLPFEKSYAGQLCALTYKNAEAVLITNYDNVVAARRLGLKNYISVPHPTMERGTEDQRATAPILRAQLEKDYDCTFVLFSPTRHHWDKAVRDHTWEKGNDHIIEGFSDLLRSGAKGLLILVEAGQHIEKSKELIRSLGIGSRVKWVKPLPHQPFIRLMMASDVVADQFGFPHTFGGIPPKALACGVPVITNIDEEVHRWCMDELPPFVLAADRTEIAKKLIELHENPKLRAEIGARSLKWYNQNYAAKIFYERVRNVAERICNDTLATRDYWPEQSKPLSTTILPDTILPKQIVPPAKPSFDYQLAIDTTLQASAHWTSLSNLTVPRMMSADYSEQDCRFTVVEPGRYMLFATIIQAPESNTRQFVAFLRNGAPTMSPCIKDFKASEEGSMSVQGVTWLNKGDTIELGLYSQVKTIIRAGYSSFGGALL